MKLVEIRDLDGPNLFLLEPAIKIEFEVDSPDEIERAVAAFGGASLGADPSALAIAGAPLLEAFHSAVGLPAPRVRARWLDNPGHFAVAFTWSRRRFAIAVAKSLAERVCDGKLSNSGTSGHFRELLTDETADDRPLMVRNIDRTIPIVGVTGTNGKTTTTRLIAHIVMQSGKHAGWSSSSGVYIDGVEVLSGDYSGPAGAHRVLTDPVVDVAVLETARGGILLRGIAYESNDVSVYTNISADHLDLQGIRTVEGLAEVKAVVCKVTSPEGTAVLNADDPLVMNSTADIRASKLLFTRQPDSPVVRDHLQTGGRAIIGTDAELQLIGRGGNRTIAPYSDMPLTFDGRARHMVENAMAAAGAAIALGLSIDQVASGLATFRNNLEQNLGRLNTFDVGGKIAIMDFAHNEVGLDFLLDIARSFASENGRVIAVIGTAGDRTDQSLRAIGEIAGNKADIILLKRTKKYLRGRTDDGLIGLYQDGVRAAGRADAEIVAGELAGIERGLALAHNGDVVVVMCHEQMSELKDYLTRIGTPR